MVDTAASELAELSRLVQAHVDWQRELGVTELSVDPQVLAPVTAKPAPRARARASNPEPAVPAPPAAPKFEMPGFLKKRSVPPSVSPPSMPPVTPVQVAAVPVPPPPEEPPAPSAKEPVISLFRDGESAPSPAPAVPSTVDGEERTRALRVLQDEVVGCTRCRLHEGRTQTVFARGNPFASLAFVGEGPGRDEDLQGAPFVGRAGELLDKIIGAMGMTENDVYICNVVKCRPPGNRVPAPDEMAMCGGYLRSQLALVHPELIVALGKTAVGYLLGTSEPMARVRGRWHEWNGIPLLATWHPAYLLRTPAAKKDTWDDMKIVLQRLGRGVPKR